MEYLKIILSIIISIIVLIGFIFALNFFDVFNKKKLENLQNEIKILKKDNADYIEKINNKNEKIKYITKEVIVKMTDKEKEKTILQLKDDILNQAEGFTFRIKESEKEIDKLNGLLKYAFKKNMIFAYCSVIIDQDLEFSITPSLNYARSWNLKIVNVFFGGGIGLKIYKEILLNVNWEYGVAPALLVGLQF